MDTISVDVLAGRCDCSLMLMRLDASVRRGVYSELVREIEPLCKLCICEKEKKKL
jgi:hypothetical protein